MSFDYDLFVIGGGSGGVRASRMAAKTGAKVALAEADRYGGTCVIRGCVPKKLMVFGSEFSRTLKEAVEYGWAVENGGFDWTKFKQRLHAELDRLEGIYRDMLGKAGVETFDARARLVDAHTVELEGGKRFGAKHILIATGGRPTRPDIEGGELAISSDELFHLDEFPKRLLVVGGGYIACEFACIFRGMGAEVCQFYRGAQVLRGFDDEARGLIADEMRAAGIDLHTGSNVLSMQRTGEGIRVKASNGAERVFDQVLYAIGREPNTSDMGLEEAGLKLGRRGEIEVDEYSKTSMDSIYAVGDVTNRMNLTPVAIREAMAFVDSVFGDKPTRFDYGCIPTAIFTQPEMGTVGLTEEAARERGPIEVYCSSFRPMRTAFIGSSQRVLMKLVVCAETRRVLGCHIVAPGAGELIQLAAIAVQMGATKEDFDRTVAVHPTISEELVTMSTPLRKA
jgi:glutathione reductase (NADPH)